MPTQMGMHLYTQTQNHLLYNYRRAHKHTHITQWGWPSLRWLKSARTMKRLRLWTHRFNSPTQLLKSTMKTPVESLTWCYWYFPNMFVISNDHVLVRFQYIQNMNWATRDQTIEVLKGAVPRRDPGRLWECSSAEDSRVTQGTKNWIAGVMRNTRRSKLVLAQVTKISTRATHSIR